MNLRVTDYIPKVGQWFDAIEKDNGRIAFRCPCKATAVKTKRTYKVIHAVDMTKSARIFDSKVWQFNKVDSWQSKEPRGYAFRNVRHRRASY